MSRRAFGLLCLAAGVVLGLAWAGFHLVRPADSVLTRFGEALPVAPLYAFFRPQAHVGALLAACGVLGAGVWLVPRPRRPAVFLLGLVLFCGLFRFAVHALRAPLLPGAELALYAGEEVVDDLPRIESPGDFLARYTAIQPTLSLHGRTKPPGLALLYYGLTRIVGTRIDFAGTAIALLGCLIVVPAYFLGRFVLDDDEPARQAAVLVAVIPSGVLYGAVSFDAVVAPVLATAFALAAWEARAPRRGKRWTLGLVLGLGLLLTYSTFPAGLLVVAFLALAQRSRPQRFLLGALEIAAATLVLPLVLFWTTGFDSRECLAQARTLNAALLRAAAGAHLALPSSWLYASIGNLLAFALSIGLPALVGLTCRRAGNGWGPEPALRIAFASTLAVACFGRIYWMETERILLFLTPVVAVLTARALPPRAAWIVSGGQALLAEALLYTLW